MDSFVLLTFMDCQDKRIKKSPLRFSPTQTGQEVMTAPCGPCFSSGRGRVTKKPLERDLNPAWEVVMRSSGCRQHHVQAFQNDTGGYGQGRNILGRKTAHIKAWKCAPVGACRLDRAKRKGKDRGRTHLMRDFTERFRFLLKIECTIKDSKLESQDLI